MNNQNQKGISSLFGIIIAIAIIVLFGGGFIAWKYLGIPETIKKSSEEKTLLREETKIEIEEVIAECKKINDSLAADRCYWTVAINTGEKNICDEIKNEYIKCSCRIVIENYTLVGTAEEILDDPEVEKFIDSQCLLPSDSSDIEVKNRKISAYMSEIRVPITLYEDEKGDYEGLSCEASANLSETCNKIKEVSGVKPTIHSSETKFCVYVKMFDENKYLCLDSDNWKAVETTISPAVGYCTGTTFICPKK